MIRLLWVLLVMTALCFGAGHYDSSSDDDRTIDAGDDVQLNVGSGRPSNEQLLGLIIAVTDEYMVIGARGGFMPNVYYKVIDGQYGPLYAAIQKESEDDPGRVIWAVYSSRNMRPDSVYVDGNNHFLSALGDGYLGMDEPENLELPSPGAYLSTLASSSARRLRGNDAGIAPLSAFDVIAKDLIAIRTQFIDLEDVDDIFLVIGGNIYGRESFRALRPLMGAIKGAGYKNVCLVFRGYNGNIDQAKNDVYQELYKPFGLELSSSCRADLELLIGQSKTASAAAYELMKNAKFTKDIDRILKDVAALQTDGDADGIGDGLAGLFGGGGGGIATKAKGNIKTPSESDVIIGSGSRNVADIMKAVRQRTPGLRHIYNKFLKKKPGFQGKVTLKFTIAPGGEVVSISIASSTTDYGEFDRAIKNAVSRWSFSKVKTGNTTVTIPFTFSE
jgi:TonB family protein